MAITRSVYAVFAAGAVALGTAATTVSAAPAWAGGPDGYVEGAGGSRAVGSGELEGAYIGFVAYGSSNDEAAAAVVAQCQNAGATECTSDEQTNDALCIVSVGGADGTVAGGAGPTVEAAEQDAYQRAGEAGHSLDETATLIISSCP